MSEKSFGLHENSLREDFFDYPDLSSSKMNFPNSSNSAIFDEKKTDGYYVSFDSKYKICCVGCVDMVNSTKISAEIGHKRTARYYQIFLNSMSKIMSEYGGMVIKNIGDCLMYYFPSSMKPYSTYGFRSCIECNLALVEAHDFICEQLHSEDLPYLDYRISLDYGSVCIMQSNNSTALDMIGPPVNMSYKINRIAEPNEVVIGGDFHEVVKSFKEYTFKPKRGYSLGYKFSYPVYSVTRKIGST